MSRRLPAVLLVLLVLLVLAGGCAERRKTSGVQKGRTEDPSTSTTEGDGAAGGGGGASTAPTTPSPTTAASASSIPELKLTKLGEFDAPVGVVLDREKRSYVIEKGGRLRQFDSRRVVLDVTDRVSTGSEQGLLGAAFSPAGDKLYIDYTDTEGDTRVVEYAVRDGSVDTATRRELLFVDQPFANHNGGHLAFGPDGFLYIALGDGGSAGDPKGNGQNRETMLGKLLRIDPAAQGGAPYRVPADNPFVGQEPVRPEIWAYGLRNPWRFSFDRETGDLWIGDVGQNRREEINRAPKGEGGQNYGWNRLEGTAKFEGTAPPGAVAPVHDYGRGEGACSVTAGVVYRGAKVRGLGGAFLFGDFCDPTVRALVPDDGRLKSVDLGVEMDQLVSFAETADGEVLIISLGGAISRLDAA